MEFSIKKFIKDLTINSLYYRTEIVCGIAGFIIGVAAATLLSNLINVLSKASSAIGSGT